MVFLDANDPALAPGAGFWHWVVAQLTVSLDFLDCGVWNSGTSTLMAMRCESAKLDGKPLSFGFEPWYANYKGILTQTIKH